MEKAKLIAGIGVGSGKKESFYFCAFQYFQKEDRWFLKNCQQLKDVKYPDTEDHLLTWINDYNVETLMLDFPLKGSVCSTCKLSCPGSFTCQHVEVLEARGKISELLEADEEFYKKEPKNYELERLKVSGDKRVISKSLKRKLKKGFIPYWHRSTDLELWLEYHDLLLKYFKLSYDSFGNENTTQMMRFEYLNRHLPKSLKLLETNFHIILLKLFQKKIISEKNLRELSGLESSALARLDMIEALEKNFNLFIYEKDKEILAKKMRAFKSFIVGFSGIALSDKDTVNKEFTLPVF